MKNEIPSAAEELLINVDNLLAQESIDIDKLNKGIAK